MFVSKGPSSADFREQRSSNEMEKKMPSSATFCAELHIQIQQSLDQFARLQCPILRQIGPFFLSRA